MFDDVVGFGVAAGDFVAVVLEADFGDESDLLATGAEGLGEDLFGVVGAVDLGGVEEGDAVVDGGGDGVAGVVDVDFAVGGVLISQVPKPRAETVRSVSPICRCSMRSGSFHCVG